MRAIHGTPEVNPRAEGVSTNNGDQFARVARIAPKPWPAGVDAPDRVGSRSCRGRSVPIAKAPAQMTCQYRRDGRIGPPDSEDERNDIW